MPDPNPNPAPDSSSATPGGGDWKSTFGADASTALADFKEPGDLFKAWQSTAGELKELKSKPADFDWRKAASGNDEKLAGVLGRYTDIGAFGKAFAEAQNKIRSGELAKPLPADASPEQAAEWRKANGIPEKPEGYFEKLPGGLVIGKEDQKIFGEFAAEMHKLNVAPPVMHEIVKWYYDLADRETSSVGEADKRQAAEATAALKEAWGGDYRGNLNLVTSFLDGMGKELKAQFLDATLPDGRRLFNSPDIVKWFAVQARELNPAGALIPPGGENQMQSLDTEIASIEKVMREKRSEYNRDEKMQQRYRDLLGAREKLKSRAA